MPYHIDEENSELAFEVREGNKLVIKIKSNIFSDSLELYLIKVGDNTEPTDKNVFSSLRVLKEIENLHDTILKEINSVTSGFWELKQDSQGNEYIATKYNVLTEGGLTTYGLGEQKLGTIYDGLPIDNDTIYWQEVDGSRVLKAKGSGGGSTGLDETKLIPLVTDQIDGILKMNEKQSLLDLNALLNPWGTAADYAIVEFNKFPKAVSFDNKAVEFFEASGDDIPRFAYTMSCQTNDAGPKNYLRIYGLGGEWDIKRIDATDDEHALISGVLIDETVDGWLLPGSLHDADANLKHTFGSNKPYNSVYSALALNAYPKDKSDDPLKENLKIKINLRRVLNIEQILNGAIEEAGKKDAIDFRDEIENLKKADTIGEVVVGLLDTLLESILDLVKYLLGETVSGVLDDIVYPALKELGLGGKQGLVNALINALAPEGGIEIELPLNVTLLNTDNLEVSGGWTQVYEGELSEMQ